MKDNATGEIIYTSINSILKGIGFKDEQVRYQRGKLAKDKTIAKGVLKFNIPTQEAAPKMAPLQTVRSILYFTTQITFSVSQNQYYAKYETEPELAAKLELYQDKCADILATVFIDRKSTAEVILQPILDAMNNLINDVNKAFPSLEKSPAKKCQ